MNRRLVFTAYQRTSYFWKVMNAWARVRGYLDWQPTVFLEPSPVADTMADIARACDVSTIVHNPVRYGVLTNPWVALGTAFGQGAEFVVLAEEDVLPSDDILEYFTWASETLRGQHILAVCAASFASPEQAAGQDHVIVPTTEFCPLIWGTWADRWRTVLRDTWDHDYSSGTPEAPQSGWDWNINLRIMADWTVVQPWASRSTHIGEHGGAHTDPVTFPQSVPPTFQAHREPAPLHYKPNR